MPITAHLVAPDAAQAADWYIRAFGATERERIPLPDGSVLTVLLDIAGSPVHVAGEFPAAGIVSPLTIGGTATVLQINVDDADALWAQALEAGAEVRHEIADAFWGERHGQLTDPFGHRWNIATRIRDVPLDEQIAAAAQMLGG